jgi:hypothetical protein
MSDGDPAPRAQNQEHSVREQLRALKELHEEVSRRPAASPIPPAVLRLSRAHTHTHENRHATAGVPVGVCAGAAE